MGELKSPNTSSLLSKSRLTTEGERRLVGSVVGDMTGVLRVLEDDEELVEDEDRRLLDGVSELNDDVRELDEIDRDGEEASEMAGLTPRCAKHEMMGERLGRGATFLPARELFRCGTKVVKRDDGLGDWNGLWLEEVTGIRRGGSCDIGGSGDGEERINAGCGAGGGRV